MDLSECLNNQHATCFVIFLSTLSDGYDLVQNVRMSEVLQIPQGQEISFKHSIFAMTLLFSSSRTHAVVLTFFAKILS